MTERRILSNEEQEIRNDLLRLSDLVETAIDRIGEALGDLDTAVCETIIGNDETINALHNEIETKVLATIATQQPVATDLRVLVAALHIDVELERIADHVAGIAKTVIKIANEEPVNGIEDVINMASACKTMLHQAIEAYMAYDAERAVEIAGQDQFIDNTQTKISDHIIKQMSQQPGQVRFGSCLLWIVHAIERIGDRTTNICEQIAYIKHGEIPDLNT